jgi:recombination protein RecA
MPRGKKKVEKTEDKDNLQATINKLKSRYPGRIYSAGEYTMPWMLKRLPTGILDLDIAIGGGLPAGGLSFFVGKQGVGKNWLANQVMREHQIRYGEDTSIAVISTEMVFDKMFARACGVRVAFSDLEIGEFSRQYEEEVGETLPKEDILDLQDQVGSFITVPPSTAEESFDIALDLVESREFDIILIDSFGSLLTEHDEDQSMSDSPRVGGAALLNTRFARRLSHTLTPNKHGDPNLTCIIGINQVRDNTNRANKYSPKTIEAGGWALKHARWLTVEMSPIQRLKEGPKRIGKTIRWEITKQKAGGHEGASGTYDYLYALTGIDRVAHSAAVAGDYHVLKRSGSWYSYGREKIGQGVQSAAAYILEQGLLDEIEAQTLAAANVRCSY